MIQARVTVSRSCPFNEIGGTTHQPLSLSSSILPEKQLIKGLCGILITNLTWFCASSYCFEIFSARNIFTAVLGTLLDSFLEHNMPTSNPGIFQKIILSYSSIIPNYQELLCCLMRRLSELNFVNPDMLHCGRLIN